jgi:Sulfotransferase domain
MASRSLKTSARNLAWQYRQATWRSRPLPDFLIVGAQKAGTVSLFSYLRQHPQLTPSTVKEVHFFDGGKDPRIDTYRKGPAWYRAHFPKRDVDSACQAFEASPLYIFNPLAPKRIFDLIPNAKLIVLLRNPTERAISHYLHVKRRGREPLPMMEALKAEEARIGKAIERQDFKNEAFRLHSYKCRGRYKEQIGRFLQYFRRQQLLILCSETFFKDPRATLRRVFEFLGVDAAFKVPDLKPRNVASNRGNIDPAARSYLNTYFQPHHQPLYDLTGENYSW